MFGVGVCTLNDSCVHTINNELERIEPKHIVQLSKSKENLTIEWETKPIDTPNPMGELKQLRFVFSSMESNTNEFLSQDVLLDRQTEEIRRMKERILELETFQ